MHALLLGSNSSSSVKQHGQHASIGRSINEAITAVHNDIFCQVSHSCFAAVVSIYCARGWHRKKNHPQIGARTFRQLESFSVLPNPPATMGRMHSNGYAQTRLLANFPRQRPDNVPRALV